MELQRVRHDWTTNTFTFRREIHQRQYSSGGLTRDVLEVSMGEGEKEVIYHWTGDRIMDALALVRGAVGWREMSPETILLMLGKEMREHEFRFTKMYAQKVSEDADHNWGKMPLLRAPTFLQLSWRTHTSKRLQQKESKMGQQLTLGSKMRQL